jgi:pimeloyl-ACP methyl ester carboxylesterase
MFQERQVAGGDGTINWMSGPQVGTPIVFLHGVGRCWQDFDALVPPLAWRWRIHGIDFRGHGLSARTPGKYLVRDYVRDAVALLTQHIDQPLILYGHSLGAMVAAATAAELPHLVHGLVLEDPPFDTLGPNIQKTQFYSLFEIMRSASGSHLPVDDLASQLAESRIAVPGSDETVRLGDVRDPTALRFGAACLKRVDPELWEPLVAGRWLEGYDKVSVLKAIRCPTLLLQGDTALGGMLPEAGGAEIETLIPRCLRIRVPGVGHLIHSLQTETTLRFLGGFLESIALDSP